MATDRIHGVLVVDKPEGPTSFDIVRRVRSVFHVKKAGHTGTLDPLATGVLLVCVGEATKIAGYLQEGDKEYVATFRLGIETDTQDALGKVIAERPAEGIGQADVETALARFRGAIQQIPPMYSALKVDGRRLYDMARAGEEIERAPRTVHVYGLELRGMQGTDVQFWIRCSRGTYLRTLAHDIGQALGCGAHLRALRRVRAGPFTIDQGISMNEMLELHRAKNHEALDARIVPVRNALSEMPEVILDKQRARRIQFGSRLGPGDLLALGSRLPAVGTRLRLTTADGHMLAVGEAGPQGVRPLRVLHA